VVGKKGGGVGRGRSDDDVGPRGRLARRPVPPATGKLPPPVFANGRRSVRKRPSSTHRCRAPAPSSFAPAPRGPAGSTPPRSRGRVRAGRPRPPAPRPARGGGAASTTQGRDRAPTSQAKSSTRTAAARSGIMSALLPRFAGEAHHFLDGARQLRGRQVYRLVAGARRDAEDARRARRRSSSRRRHGSSVRSRADSEGRAQGEHSCGSDVSSELERSAMKAPI
jgi:hypothetical protein